MWKWSIEISMQMLSNVLLFFIFFLSEVDYVTSVSEKAGPKRLRNSICPWSIKKGNLKLEIVICTYEFFF